MSVCFPPRSAWSTLSAWLSSQTEARFLLSMAWASYFAGFSLFVFYWCVHVDQCSARVSFLFFSLYFWFQVWTLILCYCVHALISSRVLSSPHTMADELVLPMDAAGFPLPEEPQLHPHLLHLHQQMDMLTRTISVLPAARSALLLRYLAGFSSPSASFELLPCGSAMQICRLMTRQPPFCENTKGCC